MDPRSNSRYKRAQSLQYFQRHHHGWCRWENFGNYAFQIVSNRYFRVMISWEEGTN